MRMDYKEKQGFVLSLVFQCPFGLPQPACPAKELRKLSLAEKISIVQGMSQLRLDTIIEQHIKCEFNR